MAVVSLKRKCCSPPPALQSAASGLDLDSSGDSDCFALDPAAFSQDASPESQQRLGLGPHTPGDAALGEDPHPVPFAQIKVANGLGALPINN